MPGTSALQYEDFIERGYSPADSRHKVNELVFGVGYLTDKDGNPIEQGKGSAAQPTPQHVRALQLEEQRRALSARSTPDAIGAVVASAIVQASAQQRSAARRKPPPRKAKVQSAATTEN